MGWPKGRKQSEEHKNKKIAASTGKKRSPEVGEKIRKALLGRGEGRSSWKYEEWRKLVLKRDGHKCVFCGSLGPKLHCHHIVPWKKSVKLRFCIENGQTLCASCHVKEGLKNKELSEKGRFKKGQKFSEEHRKKISDSLKGEKNYWFGKCLSEETKKKISASRKGTQSWNKGRPWDEETKRKVSQTKKGSIPWNKGIPCTEEMKKRISETKKQKTGT